MFVPDISVQYNEIKTPLDLSQIKMKSNDTSQDLNGYQLE
jgi:hypothetical protein